MRWLIPRLADFQDRYTDVEVHLSTGGGGLDFARDRITLAIRRLDFRVDRDWHITRLMPERVGPVMVPALLEAYRAGNFIALGSRTRPAAWRDWSAERPDAPRPRETRLLDYHFLMVEAALGGLGVALAPQAIAAQDIAAGRLIAPAGFVRDGSEYGLIQPGATPEDAATSALVDWIAAEAERAFGLD